MCQGCLILIVIGAGLIAMKIFWWVWGDWISTTLGLPRYTPHLPAKIHTSKLLYTVDKPGGFLEGCVFEAYHLSPETSQAIRKEGMKFFENMMQPEDTNDRYGPWRQTPVPPEPYIFAAGALGGCNNDYHALSAIGGTVDTEKPGNYYAVGSGRENIIIVVPSRDLVIFASFG
jgi:hypothetical protein